MDWSWTYQRFCRYMSLFPKYRVTTCSPFPHGRGKPFCTNESIVLSATGVRFFLVPFCAPPRSGLNLVPFQSSSIGLQNMRKLEMYTRNRLRYRRRYADHYVYSFMWNLDVWRVTRRKSYHFWTSQVFWRALFSMQATSQTPPQPS